MITSHDAQCCAVLAFLAVGIIIMLWKGRSV